jgi:preprotein translocase subunit SecG
MEIVIAVLYTVVVIVALLLIGLVLIQQSKTGGFGSTFGGVGESVFGAQAVNHLSKLTVILTTVFFILSLLLAAISGQRAEENRKVKAMTNELTVDAEAVKVENKANSAEVEKKIEEKSAVPAKKQAE